MYATYQQYLGDRDIEKEPYLRAPTRVNRYASTGAISYANVSRGSAGAMETYRGQKEPQSQQQPNWGDDFVKMNQTSSDSESYQAPTTDISSETNTSDPKVWGPHFWFSLHNSAAHYPINPSPIVRQRIKQRIMSIPYEIPCPSCRPHAVSFIENMKDSLDKVVSSRENLIKFYTDLHNRVNKRLGKPLWTYEQVLAKYGNGNTQISYIH